MVKIPIKKTFPPFAVMGGSLLDSQAPESLSSAHWNILCFHAWKTADSAYSTFSTSTIPTAILPTIFFTFKAPLISIYDVVLTLVFLLDVSLVVHVLLIEISHHLFWYLVSFWPGVRWRSGGISHTSYILKIPWVHFHFLILLNLHFQSVTRICWSS